MGRGILNILKCIKILGISISDKARHLRRNRTPAERALCVCLFLTGKERVLSFCANFIFCTLKFRVKDRLSS